MIKRLLALETTTNICSVAVLEAGELRAEMNLNLAKVHATHLTGMIEEVLRFSQTSWQDLVAIAVSKGPGSYTGLRIGVSVAKGLAFAQDLPLIGVNALEGLATTLLPLVANGDLICPAFDARRDEVFIAAFERIERSQNGAELIEVRPTAAKVMPDLMAWLDAKEGQKIWFTGDGAAKCVRTLQEHTNLLVSSADPAVFFPRALGIGRVATRFYQAEAFEDLARFEPYYLKDFEAGKPARSLRDRTPASAST